MMVCVDAGSIGENKVPFIFLEEFSVPFISYVTEFDNRGEELFLSYLIQLVGISYFLLNFFCWECVLNMRTFENISVITNDLFVKLELVL
jgi:hypothetical protein